MMSKQVIILILALGATSGVRGEEEYTYSRPVVPPQVTDAAKAALVSLAATVPNAASELVSATSGAATTLAQAGGMAKSFLDPSGMEKVLGVPVAMPGKSSEAEPEADMLQKDSSLVQDGEPEEEVNLEDEEKDEEEENTGFLAKKKPVVRAVKSKVIQQRLEALSGKKVDGEKLTASFDSDPWAAAKAVAGSAPMFSYLQAKRGGFIDESTKVDGMSLAATKHAREMIPAKQGNLAATIEDYAENSEEINLNLKKRVVAEVAAPLKSQETMKWLYDHGKLTKPLENPLDLEQWAKPIEEDPETADYLSKPENSEVPPDAMTELQDIPDWLNHKM